MSTNDELERRDLLQALETHRKFLRQTVSGVTDDQARQRTTVSELCLGGIIKHVSRVERRWIAFIQRGPEVMRFTESSMADHAASFQMLDQETLAGILDDYAEAAAETDELIRTIASLDVEQPLPEAPWFEPGARRSARRTLMHVLAETAQHAGHADIVREALDGAKTMG